MQSANIIDTVRIPRARSHAEKGAYAQVKPVGLLAPLFRALQTRNDLDPTIVDDVLLGCSTQSGEQGSNIAKMAAMYAGWPDSVPGASISRFCCSGLDAVNTSAAHITAGMASVMVAGGVEHLSRVPMFSDKGPWYSDKEVMRATRFMHMGLSADLIATREGYSRAQLDELALQSQQRAAHASQAGHFASALIPVTDSEGEPILQADDGIRTTTMEKLSALPESFREFAPLAQKLVGFTYPGTELDCRHTAGNAPALVDGASLVLLASDNACAEYGLKPRAKVRHFASASDEPVQMLTGHLRATEKLLSTTGLKPEGIDLWEINESFAASVLKYQQHFAIDFDKLNVNGGAIAMGHPLGATGGILIGMLLDELERRDLQRGLVAICGGAGVGVATLIERQ
ncbi:MULTISPECIES: acetyl-CoA C-acyltransferase [Microbulbifer]|uniref:acetyl-CoA C-acyltransferase n=1 Tax=Microbulbifer TaxID=48073 RepID=UPI001CD64F28|nr:acetyl-CoA C-acyltransferase [Microbulbifer agarilyticus]MCA0900042.1 acetyl-CoA C-acyltransferase [Microbulbifer agarilyticus]